MDGLKNQLSRLPRQWNSEKICNRAPGLPVLNKQSSRFHPLITCVLELGLFGFCWNSLWVSLRFLLVVFVFLCPFVFGFVFKDLPVCVIFKFSRIFTSIFGRNLLTLPDFKRHSICERRWRSCKIFIQLELMMAPEFPVAILLMSVLEYAWWLIEGRGRS